MHLPAQLYVDALRHQALSYKMKKVNQSVPAVHHMTGAPMKDVEVEYAV
jgi:hypothetical protein